MPRHMTIALRPQPRRSTVSFRKRQLKTRARDNTNKSFAALVTAWRGATSAASNPADALMLSDANLYASALWPKASAERLRKSRQHLAHELIPASGAFSS